jgi:hypothetical protein
MDTAYVVVDAKSIRDWYAGVDVSEDRDFEKESVAVAKGAVVPGFGPQGLRPSVEAGFHAVLGTFVVHTHAVQANLCAAAPKEKRWYGSSSPMPGSPPCGFPISILDSVSPCKSGMPGSE